MNECNYQGEGTSTPFALHQICWKLLPSSYNASTTHSIAVRLVFSREVVSHLLIIMTGVNSYDWGEKPNPCLLTAIFAIE